MPSFARLRRQKAQYNELYSKCIQLKLVSSDGKRYATDCFAQEDIVEVVKTLPAKNITAFLDWFTYSDNSIDGQSRKKDYLLAMHESTTDAGHIKDLLRQSMTDKIDDREIFMKGIDYSYYYEQVE